VGEGVGVGAAGADRVLLGIEAVDAGASSPAVVAADMTAVPINARPESDATVSSESFIGLPTHKKVRANQFGILRTPKF
jgi:hypothetical protein